MTENNKILAEQYVQELLKAYNSTPRKPIAVAEAVSAELPTATEFPAPAVLEAVEAAASISPTTTLAIDAPCRLGDNCGLLMVDVTTAKGALPVAGAHVSITDENGTIQAFITTDISGKTHSISLPTPPESLSEVPESALKPYASYNVRVTAKGFYPMEVLHVPVFDTVQSIQPIDLIPLMEYETDPNRTITYTTTEPNL